jgi:hypothetical protein
MLEADIYLATQMTGEQLSTPLIKVFRTTAEGVNEAMGRLGHSASIWALPKGRSVLPRLKGAS